MTTDSYASNSNEDTTRELQNYARIFSSRTRANISSANTSTSTKFEEQYVSLSSPLRRTPHSLAGAFRNPVPAQALYLQARFACIACDHNWLEDLIVGAMDRVEEVVMVCHSFNPSVFFLRVTDEITGRPKRSLIPCALAF